MCCFPDFFELPSVFSCSSMSFLKTAILNSLLGKVQASVSLRSVPRRLLWSSGSVMFPWFFSSLKSHIVVFTPAVAVTSSDFYWVTWGVKSLPSVLPEILRPSQPSIYGYIPPRYLLPLVAEFLSLYAFSWTCNTPSQVLTASLLFSQGLS